MTATIKHSVCNDEIRYCLVMIEGQRYAHSSLKVDVPMDEAMKWLEAFSFNMQDFVEDMHYNNGNASAILTSISGFGIGSNCVSLEFSVSTFNMPSMDNDAVVGFWDEYVKSIVDNIRCIVVEHDLKSALT